MSHRVYLVTALIIGALVFKPALAQTNDNEILARTPFCVVTAGDVQDILAMDGAVLETPLTHSEVDAGRARILSQFRSNPEGACKGLPLAHKAAGIVRHGSLTERTELGAELWAGWLLNAAHDKTTAEWVAIVIQHNPPIVTGDGLTVSRLQLNAMFASNDWVAHTANLPVSTAESRKAVIRDLRSKFAALPPAQKEWYTQADLRWFALQTRILHYSDLRTKAVSIVRGNVHSAGDVANEARSLEDEGLKFLAVMAKYRDRAARIAGLAGDEANLNNLRNAKGPDLSTPPPHYPDPHNHH
jgi:hypothetical protein